MMFSKTCEYAIKAMIFVCSKSRSGERVCLQDIAEYINSPVAFTSKVLQKLCKNELLTSIKGPSGGFIIEEPKLATIRIIEIVLAIDGNDLIERCALGLEHCSSIKPCPMHTDFTKIREQIIETLVKTNLQDLAVRYEKGHSYLMN